MRMAYSVSIMLIVLAGVSASNAQQAADPRMSELLQAGKIRIAMFEGQYSKDTTTGEVRGVALGIISIELVRRLADRLGINVEIQGYTSPAEVVQCLQRGGCDVGFMGANPARASEVGFSPPFLASDFTYLVPADSSIRTVANADQLGVRIAAVPRHQSTLVLQGVLKSGQLVPAETLDGAFDLLRTGRADALASVRSALLEYSAKLSGSRVLEDSYGANLLSIAVSRNRIGQLTYISEFVEDAKRSGLLQQILERSGQRGARVTAASQ